MKTLTIVRHAKSSWSDSSIDDASRPLNKRGFRDAPFMAELMQKKKMKPDLIYSSHANRALTTAKFFAEALGYPQDDIKIERKIYFEGMSSILGIVENTAPNVNVVFLFGHNPDLTSLCMTLSGERLINLPTCGVFCVDFDIDDWGELTSGLGKKRFFEYPKKYF